ncbi:MAG: type II secretion system GspH family protein [bacterium]|nr:type II secretion system GspH family protein [bacterium]
MNNKNKAFTLAELLIAMLLFALLAVILVPNVTNNAEKELFSTQIKKIQNDVQQALLVMLTQNQGSLRMMCAGEGSSKCFIKEISEKLEKNVVYSNSDVTGCAGQDLTNKKNERAQACLFKERKPQFMNKQNANFIVNGKNTTFYAVNLKNGASVAAVFDPNCNKGTSSSGANITDWDISVVVDTVGIKPANICGYMEIDVNAGKVPNVVGKDIHYFWIVDQDGIMPFGEVDKFTCGEVENGKIKKMPKEVANENQQLGCTYRILQRNNIDYY